MRARSVPNASARPPDRAATELHPHRPDHLANARSGRHNNPGKVYPMSLHQVLPISLPCTRRKTCMSPAAEAQRLRDGVVGLEDLALQVGDELRVGRVGDDDVRPERRSRPAVARPAGAVTPGPEWATELVWDLSWVSSLRPGAGFAGSAVRCARLSSPVLVKPGCSILRIGGAAGEKRRAITVSVLAACPLPYRLCRRSFAWPSRYLV
jgi:hypothetical protein